MVRLPSVPRTPTTAYGMEGTMDMTSNGSNNTATASAPDNQQQEAVVSSPTKKEEQAWDSKKALAAQQAGGSGEPKPRPSQDAVLCCPRCCSTNTKFCYYNNYNLNQPRYFCKACRRYWTQGGTLRPIPVGGGFRRNKRASGSSSSSTAATSAEVQKTVKTRLTLTAMATTTSTTMSIPSPTTDLLFPNDMLSAFMPIDDSGLDLDLAMEDQQGFLPFSPLSLSDDLAPELAPGGSDEMMSSFLDMLREEYFDCGGSSSYGGGLDMSGCNNGMDIPFPLLEMGALTTDPIQMQLMEGMNDVAGELLWASSELDNYINNDDGFAARRAAGVQQQQQEVVGDQQMEDENKQNENNKSINDNGVSSSVYNYWINTTTTNNDGAEG